MPTPIFLQLPFSFPAHHAMVGATLSRKCHTSSHRSMKSPGGRTQGIEASPSDHRSPRGTRDLSCSLESSPCSHDRRELVGLGISAQPLMHLQQLDQSCFKYDSRMLVARLSVAFITTDVYEPPRPPQTARFRSCRDAAFHQTRHARIGHFDILPLSTVWPRLSAHAGFQQGTRVPWVHGYFVSNGLL